MSGTVAMDVAEISLDDIIKKQRAGKGRQSGGDRPQRRGVQRGGISKPKRNANKWGNDKFFELIKGGNRGGSSGKSICRLSNVPFNVTQDELDDLFAEYRLSRCTLHYDQHGRSLGTAELHGARDVINRLAGNFRNVEIDGRLLGITIVNEGSSSRGGSPRRAGNGRRAGPRVTGRRDGGRQDGARRDGGRGNGGGAKRDTKKKLTSEELDRELDEYMKKS
ncbi:Aly/REF export factor 2-like protein [Aphelenchoides besseyi]|nr:Aly/REF export factor 2-like protein [Aphelenchoides besseyi]KAI6229385.1 Aly/REF export factor 2-like protein [Aphelenchoides besseyi]